MFLVSAASDYLILCDFEIVKASSSPSSSSSIYILHFSEVCVIVRLSLDKFPVKLDTAVGIGTPVCPTHGTVCHVCQPEKKEEEEGLWKKKKKNCSCSTMTAEIRPRDITS